MTSLWHGIAALGTQWHYAAWVALDLRLLLFLVLIAALGGMGIAAMFVKHDRVTEHAATFLLAFVALLIVLIIIFNAIAHYPVFVIESFFPFP